MAGFLLVATEGKLTGFVVIDADEYVADSTNVKHALDLGCSKLFLYAEI